MEKKFHYGDETTQVLTGVVDGDLLGSKYMFLHEPRLQNKTDYFAKIGRTVKLQQLRIWGAIKAGNSKDLVVRLILFWKKGEPNPPDPNPTWTDLLELTKTQTHQGFQFANAPQNHQSSQKYKWLWEKTIALNRSLGELELYANFGQKHVLFDHTFDLHNWLLRFQGNESAPINGGFYMAALQVYPAVADALQVNRAEVACNYSWSYYDG